MKNALTYLGMFICGALFIAAGQQPPKQAQAAPVVVGSPPGELARLQALVADLQAARETDRQQILALEESLAVAKATPKSNCQAGLCEICQCPGDGRCAAGECQPKAEPQVAYRRVWVSTGRRRGYYVNQAYYVQPQAQAGGGCVSCR